MGRVFSAFLLGYALCQVPAGMLADRFGARRVLALAAFSWVAATALIAVAPAAAALPVLLAARLLLGIGEAPTFPAAAQAISRYVPPRARGRANGLVIAAIGLGSAIAPPLVTSVMVRSAGGRLFSSRPFRRSPWPAAGSLRRMPPRSRRPPTPSGDARRRRAALRPGPSPS